MSQTTPTPLEKLEQTMQETHEVIDDLLVAAAKGTRGRKAQASLQLARAGIREMCEMIVNELTLEDLLRSDRSRGKNKCHLN